VFRVIVVFWGVNIDLSFAKSRMPAQGELVRTGLEKQAEKLTTMHHVTTAYLPFDI
jgi:hypothetical protein